MLHHMELSVSKDHFYTSALATASFLKSQCPGGSVYVIGEPELMKTLYKAGFPMNDADPDYVVFGGTSFFYEKIERAVKLIQKVPSKLADLRAANANSAASPRERGRLSLRHRTKKPTPLGRFVLFHFLASFRK